MIPDTTRPQPLACQVDAGRVATRWTDHVHASENAVVRANLDYARESRGAAMSVRVAVMVSRIQEHVTATDRRAS